MSDAKNIKPPRNYGITPERRTGMLKKAARIGATIIATRVAATTGKKGVFGILAGMGAKRIIMRYPAGALFVTGAYMAGKIYEAKREVDRQRQQKLLTDQSNNPILLDDARKARRSGG